MSERFSLGPLSKTVVRMQTALWSLLIVSIDALLEKSPTDIIEGGVVGLGHSGVVTATTECARICSG